MCGSRKIQSSGDPHLLPNAFVGDLLLVISLRRAAAPERHQEAPLSALSRPAPKYIALAIPALALFHLAACSTDDSGTAPTQFVGNGETPAAAAGAPSGEEQAPPSEAATGGEVTPGGEVAPGEMTSEGSPGMVALDDPGAGVAPPSGAAGAGSPAATPVTEPVPFVCVLPELPDNLQDLGYVNEKLPDPFTFLDGTKVTTKEQWDCRRK